MKILKATIILFLSFIGSLHALTQEELQQYAVNQNDAELIEIIMKYGDRQDYPILDRAMDAKDYFAVFMLIEYGVDINSRSSPNTKTVLEKAIECDEIALVEYFLLKGADPTNIRKYEERYTLSPLRTSHYITTAVHDAIKFDRLDVLTLFLRYNVDLDKICYEKDSNYQISFKNTPLRTAVEYKKQNIITFLVSIKAKL